MISDAPHTIRCPVPVFQQAENDLKNSTALLKNQLLWGIALSLTMLQRTMEQNWRVFPMYIIIQKTQPTIKVYSGCLVWCQCHNPVTLLPLCFSYPLDLLIILILFFYTRDLLYAVDGPTWIFQESAGYLWCLQWGFHTLTSNNRKQHSNKRDNCLSLQCR